MTPIFYCIPWSKFKFLSKLTPKSNKSPPKKEKKGFEAKKKQVKSEIKDFLAAKGAAQ